MKPVNERSLYRRINDAVNVPLLLVAAALLIYGVVVVSSATSGMGEGSGMLRRQLLGIGIGVIPLAFAWLVDYRRLKHWLGPLVFLLAFLLISPRIPGLGYTASGATSWLQIAGVRLFQPSEPAKLIFIIVMAALVSRYEGRLERPRDVLTVL